MLQNTRTRLVAPGFASAAGLEALAFEPWTELTRQMDRLAAGHDGAEPMPAWVPAVDVEEREDAVVLAFEVPGVAPDALDVTVHDRVLTVSGERRLGRREDGTAAYRLERRHGRFARRLTLPKTVDPDRIEARHEHGVLYLHLPKRPEAQPRRITVSVAPSTADQRQLDPGRADA